MGRRRSRGGYAVSTRLALVNCHDSRKVCYLSYLLTCQLCIDWMLWMPWVWRWFETWFRVAGDNELICCNQVSPKWQFCLRRAFLHPISLFPLYLGGFLLILLCRALYGPLFERSCRHRNSHFGLIQRQATTHHSPKRIYVVSIRIRTRRNADTT